MHRILPAATLVIALFVALLPGARDASADEGWVIDRFGIDITVEPDGDLRVVEEIAIDFGGLTRHGIFRDLVTHQPCGEITPSGGTTDAGFSDVPAYAAACPSGSDRVYDLDVVSVARDGDSEPYEILREGRLSRIKIGDADRSINGEQFYRLEYTIGGALNAFTDHDELYWNVTGLWPVVMEQVDITVHLPDGADVVTACFEGYGGATFRCTHAGDGPIASYSSTRALFENEQVTIVAGWQKGIVDVQPPVIKDRPSIDDFFTFDLPEFVAAAVTGLLSFLGLGLVWWRFGRDRAYTSIHYLTNDPTEETRPLFARREVVVEYLPPDDLRPAQMGVLLDERADTLDVTATIVDLAVRGYLHIEEIPKKGWFGSRDWELHKRTPEAPTPLPYEEKLYSALFSGRESVKVSTLKNTFYKTVNDVRERLYKDSVQRKWFRRSPESMRNLWSVIAIAVIVTGAGLAVGAAYLIARPLIFVPIVVAGLVLLVLSRAMSRRTATGTEALRRVLGFREYVATAETHLQKFNEDQNIFARYLPYAIVFGCVEKWANAFAQIGVTPSTQTAGWYTGVGAFSAASFSSDMRSFSSGLSTAISSTPGGSGGSGFSGGSSGGGGGGGGGGSW
ncbi:MAG: DUF2207 domain-containing protein [Tepidiformaceae bacterium]